MREMTQKEKIKYKQLVSEAQQLRFDVDFLGSGDGDVGLPLYICKDGHMQYFFSRYPADEGEEGTADAAAQGDCNDEEAAELLQDGNDITFFDSGMFQFGFNFFE